MAKNSALIFTLLTASALSAQPNNELNALLQQSRQKIAQGRFAEAEADLNTLIAKAHEKHLPMHELLGYEAFSSLKERQNDPDAAEQWLNKALASSAALSSPLPALLDLQAFYARHQLYSKEADTLSKIIAVWSSSVDPNSLGVARYTSLLGGVYFDMGKNQDAEASLRSAIAILDKNGSPDASDSAKRSLLKVLMKEEKREDVANLIPSMNPDPPKRQHPDVNPRIISKIEPKYSEQARKLKLSGSVAVSLEVDEKGIPTNLKVIGPLGVGLDENAIDAVSSWRFNPGTSGGKPVVTPAVVQVNFRLL